MACPLSPMMWLRLPEAPSSSALHSAEESPPLISKGHNGSQGRGLSQKSVAKRKHFAISSATHLALSRPGRTPLVLVGYARVSTDDQDLTLQRTALKQAGCKRIYEEKVSGATRDRPALTRMLDQLREGDVVVVARLDRLSRPPRDLLEIAEILKEGGTGLRSLGEPWADTTSPAGKMVLTVFAGMAEFERALIHQRTSSGRVAARMRGVRFGRPSKLTPEQVALGCRLVDEGTSVREVAKVILKCHPATLYRELGKFGPASTPANALAGEWTTATHNLHTSLYSAHVIIYRGQRAGAAVLILAKGG